MTVHRHNASKLGLSPYQAGNKITRALHEGACTQPLSPPPRNSHLNWCYFLFWLWELHLIEKILLCYCSTARMLKVMSIQAWILCWGKHCENWTHLRCRCVTRVLHGATPKMNSTLMSVPLPTPPLHVSVCVQNKSHLRISCPWQCWLLIVKKYL